jgi:RNA polymerase sigma-70 factor (ECF subfamily)
MTETEIIAGCQRGEVAARKALYDRTVDRIYGLVMRVSGNPDDAFDLAQETYLRAFERINQFRGGSSVITWLYRIAVNESLQLRRKRKSEGAHLVAVGRHANDGQTTCATTSARMDVQSALGILDESDRTILLLRYEHGLDYRELALVLDCAEGTVASRLNRARQKMHELLAGGYDPKEEDRPLNHPKIWTDVIPTSEIPPYATRKSAGERLPHRRNWNAP